jgi:hypothetical protein
MPNLDPYDQTTSIADQVQGQVNQNQEELRKRRAALQETNRTLGPSGSWSNGAYPGSGYGDALK